MQKAVEGMAVASSLRLILVDSETKAQALNAAGFRGVRIALSEEAVCSIVNKESVLDPTLSFFDEFVIIVGDPDLRDRLAVRLGDTRCRWADWPRDATGNQLRDLIQSAKPMWVDEICLMSDVPDAGTQRVYNTGFPLLDEHGFRLIRPAFMPIIGPYGSGKSVLVRQLACNLYRLHGWRTLITAFEEKIKPRYQRDLRRHMIGTEDIDPDGEIRWTPKHESMWTEDDIRRADHHVEDAFRFLRRKRNTILDVDRLIERIEFGVKVYGVDVVIIDPMNEIDHQVPKGVSKTDYMGTVMMRLKQLADDYSLVMIVCAHPPKAGVEKRTAANQLLTLNDGADTAHYGNKADIGWCVWRPGLEDDCPTYPHIDKLKDHDVMGRPTLAKLQLDRGMGRFNVTRIGYEEVGPELAGNRSNVE